MELESIPFVRAQHFRTWRLPTHRPIDFVVLHTAECAEAKGSANAVARYFMAPGNYPMNYPVPELRGTPIVSSAHYVTDDASVIQCVQLDDIANAAPPMNDAGVHIEMCGWAKQSIDDWDDAFSRSMIALASELTAALCNSKLIPPVWVDDDGLRKWAHDGPGSLRGITDHATISRVFKKSSHVDPGKNFPRTDFIERVQGFLPYPVG